MGQHRESFGNRGPTIQWNMHVIKIFFKSTTECILHLFSSSGMGLYAGEVV